MALRHMPTGTLETQATGLQDQPVPVRASRVTNLVVASVYLPVSVGNAIGEPWTYFFGLAVALEVLVLALILGLAWTWPRSPVRS